MLKKNAFLPYVKKNIRLGNTLSFISKEYAVILTSVLKQTIYSLSFHVHTRLLSSYCMHVYRIKNKNKNKNKFISEYM